MRVECKGRRMYDYYQSRSNFMNGDMKVYTEQNAIFTRVTALMLPQIHKEALSNGLY